MEHDNQPFGLGPDNLPAHRGYSTQSSARPPSAETEEIVRELDIRFPPNSTIGEADREAQVLYLASDLSDIDPSRLRAAAKEWIRTKPYMPKASELRALCHTLGATQSLDERAEVGLRVARSYNARLAGEQKDKGIRWVYNRREDSLRLVPTREWEGDMV